EMVGVKSGIGFYLQWAQGWAAYPNMRASKTSFVSFALCFAMSAPTDCLINC
ncbi:hypothetical protein ACTXQV_80585, partial [Klebsiella pneumoniae]